MHAYSFPPSPFEVGCKQDRVEGGKIKQLEEFLALSLFIFRFQNMEGGCEVKSLPRSFPSGSSSCFLLPANHSSAHRAKHRPFQRGSISNPTLALLRRLVYSCLTKICAFHYVFFRSFSAWWRLLLKVIYTLWGCFAIMWSSSNFPSSTVSTHGDHEMCACVVSDGVHGCSGKSEPGGRSYARVTVCFARLLSQIS